jgi:hypothetical protein
VNRRLLSTIAAVSATAGLVGPAGVASARSTAARTTAPQAIRLDSVVLANGTIRLAFTQIPRGDVVVFKVHNGSTRRARFLIVPKTTASDPGQGGSGFRTQLLAPGDFASFQVEFSNRGVFEYSVVDGTGKTRATGRFLVV